MELYINKKKTIFCLMYLTELGASVTVRVRCQRPKAELQIDLEVTFDSLFST